AARLTIAGPLERYLLRVGELLIVVEEILAAEGRYSRRMRGHAQAPYREVDLVDAVVSHIAAPEVVPPVPFVMKTIRLKRHPLGWADPRVVINLSRRARGLCVAD